MSNIKQIAFDEALLALEVRRILASPQFAKAYRAQLLLRHLLDRARGDADTFNEYAIGLAVFGRQAATYSTGDDPIVRVQVGRLRRRLRDYYADEGRSSTLRIVIPLGTYRPHVVWCPVQADIRLAFEPCTCHADDVDAHRFAQGLNAELQHRLYQDFGAGLVQHLKPGTASHLLQGNVQRDEQRLCTTLRLWDVHASRITWSEHIQHNGEAGTDYQARLAQACSQALRCHLTRV